MDNRYPPLYRSRPKRRDWRNWIIAIAATIAIAGAMALAYDAESAMLPPRPGTERTLPAPVGRHEMRLYCRNFLQPGQAAKSAECRRIGDYR